MKVRYSIHRSSLPPSLGSVDIGEPRISLIYSNFSPSSFRKEKAYFLHIIIFKIIYEIFKSS
jgi:hypothetical protein